MTRRKRVTRLAVVAFVAAAAAVTTATAGGNTPAASDSPAKKVEGAPVATGSPSKQAPPDADEQVCQRVRTEWADFKSYLDALDEWNTHRANRTEVYWRYTDPPPSLEPGQVYLGEDVWSNLGPINKQWAADHGKPTELPGTTRIDPLPGMSPELHYALSMGYVDEVARMCAGQPPSPFIIAESSG
jgi:hypothetical protein